MTIARAKFERVEGMLAVAGACAYLIPFVPRGWMPHDEGMLGQAADLVLHGATPHVGYEEPYSGALSWLYASVFRFEGVDLLHVRWLLFAAACATAWLVYAICRRFLTPVGAAVASWVAVVWSFPNYFAALPSWWLLLCALACVWAVIRYAETERRQFVAIAGLAAGAAIAVKQTGVYLLAALAIPLAYGSSSRALRWLTAIGTLLCAAAILRPRLLEAEGLYLFCPVAACALALLAHEPERPGDLASSFRTLALAGFWATLPLLALVLPYILRGNLRAFINGAVLLPQKRLAFASMSAPSAWLAFTALPPIVLVFVASRRQWLARSTIAKTTVWLLAIALPVLALRNTLGYQAMWQSTRAFAAFLPVVMVGQIVAGEPRDRGGRLIFLMLASTLAWVSVNQFPFAAPIYFSYVAPLGVVAAVAATGGSRAAHAADAMLPWAVSLIMFAVLSTNRGYIQNLGVAHERRLFDSPLALPRAHLRVSGEDALTYRNLIASIENHLRGGQLVAGPDCPEVYFLAGLVNPSGTLFDFFSGADADDPSGWRKGDLIVLNHNPGFSPRPSEQLLATVRTEFAHGETFGRFEVRWR